MIKLSTIYTWGIVYKSHKGTHTHLIFLLFNIIAYKMVTLQDKYDIMLVFVHKQKVINKLCIPK